MSFSPPQQKRHKQNNCISDIRLSFHKMIQVDGFVTRCTVEVELKVTGSAIVVHML